MIGDFPKDISFKDIYMDGMMNFEDTSKWGVSEWNKNQILRYFNIFQIHSPGAITVELDVTPEIAKILKENHNTSNRKVSEEYVKILVNAIKEGRFRNNYLPIIIDKDGQIIDGGHRIDAVSRAGKTVRMFFVIGVDPGLITTYDRGRKRNLGQHLDTPRFSGSKVPNANSVAQVANYLFKYRNGTMKSSSGRHAASMEQGLEIALNEQEGIQESIKWGSRLYDVVGTSLGSGAFCHYIFSEIDGNQADEFFTKLTKGIGFTDEYDPILILRNTLLKTKSQKDNTLQQIIAKTIKAWNFHREGKIINKLSWTTKEKFPIAK